MAKSGADAGSGPASAPTGSGPQQKSGSTTTPAMGKADTSIEAATLTPQQTHALFTILTHHETYAEIESLKRPDTLSQFGYPFTQEDPILAANASTRGTSKAPSAASSAKSSRAASPAPTPAASIAANAGPKIRDTAPAGTFKSVSETPILQTLVSRFLLTLPGARDVPPEFWSVRVQGLLKRLAEADLSESYDKGTMGTRKTLATALSAIVEALVRGLLGGCPVGESEAAGEKQQKTKNGKYDLKRASDLEKAFGDALHQIVYGNLLDEVVDHLTKTDDLESHSDMMEAAVEYEIIHVATLFHQVFVLSPEGQYLLKLIENVHGMLPYSVIRQTLRMSNAATMMSGMVKLFLSKLSIGSITNYLGVTKNAEDGMNLLQRIISIVLGWDSAEFKKTTDAIEKADKGPSKECLAALRDHVQQKTPEDRKTARQKSEETSKSIIAIILDDSDTTGKLSQSLSEDQHRQCQEYLAATLSIRDRDEITSVLCKQSPDLFTQAVRDFVSGYEPYIRAIHEKVDLREHVENYQSFVDQFIAASKPKKVGGDGPEAAYRAPSVEDYVALFRKNKYMFFRWAHQGAKQAPEVRDTFRDWAKESVIHFRKPGVPVKGSSVHVEGVMMEKLPALVAEVLSEDEASRAEVLGLIDAHAAYLDAITQMSRARMQDIVDGDAETMAGPGVFLIMWQALMDETAISPGPGGKRLRHGWDIRDVTAEGKTGTSEQETQAGDDAEAARREANDSLPGAPDVSLVVEKLGPGFKRLVAEMEAAPGGTGAAQDGDARSDISID